MSPLRGLVSRDYGRPAVFLVSALFHLGLLLVLAEQLSKAPPSSEAPSIQVFLVPPVAPPATPPKARGDSAPPRLLRRPRRPDASDLALPKDSRPAIRDTSAGLDAPPADGVAIRAQRALRGLVGCDQPRPGQLTAEERERCETRRWAGSRPGNARLNLDPSGRYVENPEPYLVRKPKNGCRLRATGEVDAMGETGNVRTGVGCAFSF